MDTIEEFLSHYGTKGMKWGVRKKRSVKDEKLRNKRKKTLEKRRHLSDEDLKKYIDRLSSEKKLKDLIEADITPGKSVAKRIMSESGQKVAKTVAVGLALYGVKAVVSKEFNAKEAAGYLAPKPKNK